MSVVRIIARVHGTCEYPPASPINKKVLIRYAMSNHHTGTTFTTEHFLQIIRCQLSNDRAACLTCMLRWAQAAHAFVLDPARLHPPHDCSTKILNDPPSHKNQDLGIRNPCTIALIL